MAATFEDVMSGLRKKDFKPVYFLAGEEPYYIDQISDHIENNALPEAERSFNQIVLYGEDTTVQAVIENARRFPMMSAYQVIIVKEAQSLRKIEDLTVYLEHPLASTILVICHKYRTPDKRTRMVKLSETKGVYFESPKIRDYQIPSWIERYLMAKGIRIDASASAMLTEYLGTDLHKISNELEKLMITLPQAKPVITSDLIEKNIGISKDYNNFELQKAVGERNILKSNMIVNYFARNQKENPLLVTIASLFSFFSKLLVFHYLQDKSKSNVASALKINPYFVKDYESAAMKYNAARTIQVIGLLRTYDVRSKGFEDPGTDPGDLLRELVYRILHL